VTETKKIKKDNVMAMRDLFKSNQEREREARSGGGGLSATRKARWIR